MAPDLPRFSVGRSLSSGGLSSEGLSFSGGVFACACACVCGDGVVGDEEEVEGAVVGGGVAAPGELVEAEAVCEGVEGSAGGSVDLGLSPLRRSTGGPSSSFRPRGTDGGGFFLVFALRALADCQVPSAIHSAAALASFLCSAPVTVNSPCETPVSTPS